MKLKAMKLLNFQSFKEFEFIPDGKDCSVYGDNGTGKTTLYNALCWLLFDKPSNEEKSWSPKTYDKDGNEIPKLEHSVWAEFELDALGTITFEKVLSEKWVTKRGSKDNKFEGNTVAYTINDVPVTMTEFNSRVKELLYDATMMQIVSKPFFFAQELHWEDRRKLLLEMCGDVSVDRVISSDPSTLSDLSEYLQDGMHTVDELFKIARERIKKTKDELEDIPVRINEATMARPDVDCTAAEKTKARIAELRSLIEEKHKEKAAHSSADEEQSIKREIANIEIERDMAEAAYKKKFNEDNQALNDTIFSKQQEMRSLSSRINSLDMEISRLRSNLTHLTDERARFLANYKEVEARQWKGDTVCSTCGQPLPADKVQESKDRFNVDKSSILEKITADCQKCSKSVLASLQSDIEEKEKQKAESQSEYEKLSAEIETLKNQQPKLPPFSSTQEYLEFSSRISACHLKIRELKENIVSRTTLLAIDSALNNYSTELNELTELLLKIEQAEKQQKRIDEIADREVELNEILAHYEKALYLCEAFYKTKSRLLNSIINTHFQTVEFKLFEEQINGGLKECCEVMIPCPSGLIPFGKANTASQINAGLEIIDVITKHYGRSLPIFIDNAESVIELRAVGPQIIKLIVKEGCDSLKVVTA